MQFFRDRIDHTLVLWDKFFRDKNEWEHRNHDSVNKTILRLPLEYHLLIMCMRFTVNIAKQIVITIISLEDRHDPFSATAVENRFNMANVGNKRIRIR
jgi:hypothetical protein